MLSLLLLPDRRDQPGSTSWDPDPPGAEAMLDALQAALAGNAANLPDRPNDQGA
jgi:hypothetical protein